MDDMRCEIAQAFHAAIKPEDRGKMVLLSITISPDGDTVDFLGKMADHEIAHVVSVNGYATDPIEEIVGYAVEGLLAWMEDAPNNPGVQEKIAKLASNPGTPWVVDDCCKESVSRET